MLHPSVNGGLQLVPAEQPQVKLDLGLRLAVASAPFADVDVETVQTETDSMTVEVMTIVSPGSEVENEKEFPGSVNI